MKDKDRIIDTACRIAGISREEFHNKKIYLASNARLFLYRHYEKKGLNHQQIAKMVGKARSTITFALSGFRMKYKYDERFRQMYDHFAELTKTEEQDEK